MAWNFRKRIKILPGVTLNVGKTGVSTSVGKPGARITLGKNGTRTTVGLPGTGISHSVVEPPTPATTVTGFRSSSGYIIAKSIGVTFLAICAAVVVFFGAIALSGGKKKRRR